MIAPLAVYLVVCLAGITQSSIGVDELRQDPADPTGVMLGDAQSGRSDEYLTSTPLQLGVAATGRTDDHNPLTAPNAVLGTLPSGPVTSLVFLDGTALRLGTWLPDAPLVTARLWLGLLLLLLAAPAWFRALTGSRWIGWFAVALIVVSPSNAWWSGSPASLMGFALAGCYGLLKAASAAGERQWWRMAAWGVLGAALLVRTPLLYPPWAFVVVSALGVATLAFVLAPSKGRWRRLLGAGFTAAAGIALGVAVLLENREAFAATTGTVYPGARVVTGAAMTAQLLFGATNLRILIGEVTSPGINPSEMSAGFTVALVVALMLVLRGLRWRVPGQRAAVIALGVMVAAWMSWCTFEWGEFGTRIPLANMVPPARVAQVIGHVGVIALCLVLPSARARGSVWHAGLMASVAAGVSGYAGSLLRTQNLPEMSLASIWGAAVAVGVVVFLICWRPRRPWGFVLAVVLAASMVWSVNPVLVGMADLRGSATAQQMMDAGREARADQELWATDHFSTDALLLATGVPSVTGRQMTGPEPAAWERLDDGLAHEDFWNRGGSYIWFSWIRSPEIIWENPNPDVIYVKISPCTLAERMPRVSTVISRKELKMRCLTEAGTIEWGGATRWVYTIDR